MYDDTELTPEEKKLIAEIESSKGDVAFGTGIGSGVGTAVGAGLSVIPVLTPFAPALIGGGGALGGLIGGGIGAATSGRGAAAQRKLDALQKQRMEEENKKQSKDVEAQARLEAFNRLLGKYSYF